MRDSVIGSNLFRSASRVGVVALSLLAVGCSANVDSNGYVLRPEAVAQLEPGRQDTEAVRRLLGTPSSVAPFDPNVWYYIGQTTETVAFFDPTVTGRHILVLRFDDTGTLAEMNTLSGENGRQVALVSRETPTRGHSLGFMEQLLGNLGRFNKPEGLGN